MPTPTLGAAVRHPNIVSQLRIFNPPHYWHQEEDTGQLHARSCSIIYILLYAAGLSHCSSAALLHNAVLCPRPGAQPPASTKIAFFGGDTLCKWEMSAATAATQSQGHQWGFLKICLQWQCHVVNYSKIEYLHFYISTYLLTCYIRGKIFLCPLSDSNQVQTIFFRGVNYAWKVFSLLHSRENHPTTLNYTVKSWLNKCCESQGLKL